MSFFLGHKYLDKKQKRIFSFFGVCFFVFFVIGIVYETSEENELRNIIFQNKIKGRVVDLSVDYSGAKSGEIKFMVKNDSNIYYINKNTSNVNYSGKYISKYLIKGVFVRKVENSNEIVINDTLVFQINQTID